MAQPTHKQPTHNRRDRLLRNVAQDWASFQESLSALPDAAYSEPGVVGHWSLRDLLVHITSWEEEALKAIPVILEGRRLPRYSQLYGGIEAFNAKTQAANEGMDLSQVRSNMWSVHRQLVSQLGTLPEEALISGGRLARRLRQDTYEHYREHACQVIDWRRQKNL